MFSSRFVAFVCENNHAIHSFLCLYQQQSFFCEVIRAILKFHWWETHVNMVIICSFQNNRNASSSSYEQRQRSERRIINPVGPLPRRHSTSASRPSPNLITITGSSQKRDRSQSLSVDEDRRRGGSTASSRYKTELCRPFEENGTCKYGDKCQFAHGIHEVRQLSRHPKYKTELCRTFHTIGFCPYGPRCHFIHNADEKRSSSGNRMSPVGPPSPPSLTDLESPLPTSLTPPSPSPLSFYDDNSPLASPLPIPMANSPRVNNVFTFPPHARDFSMPSSPTIATSPQPFSPLPDHDEQEEENLPPSPPDSLDGFGNRRRLPVFNQLSIE